MLNKGRTFNTIKNISFGFICQFVTIFVSFANRTIFIRLLGEEYTGIGSLFSNILTFLSLAEFGVGNVLAYSLYSPIKEGNKEKVCQYLCFFRKIYICIAGAVLLLGIAAIPVLPTIIGKTTLPMNEIKLYYVLYLLNSVVSYFVIYKTTMLQADQKVYIKTVTQTTASVLMRITMTLYLMVTKNYVGYLIIQVIFNLAQNIFLSYITSRIYPYLSTKTEPPEKGFVLKVVRDVKAMFLYKAAGMIINYTDNILISVLLGVSMVGFYSNYYLIISYIIIFMGHITAGVAGSLGNFNVNQDANRSYKMFNNLLYFISLITIICCCCYTNLIQGFVKIWIGERYILDYSIVLSLVFSFYINNIISPVWMYRESMGMFREIKYTLLIAAVLNIVLSVILGKVMGLSGIIIATGIARLVTVVWYEPCILFKRKFKMKSTVYFIYQLKQLMLNMMIFLISIVICRFIKDDIIGLLARAMVCIVVIVVIEFVFMRNTDEFRWVANKIKCFFKKTNTSKNGI